MPSKRLTDCETRLADAFLQTRDEYETMHPGHHLIVDCTARSPEEQTALYHVGRCLGEGGEWVEDSDPKTFIVTQLDGVKKKSKHNYAPSRALDFHIEIQGKPVWDLKAYAPVGVIAAHFGLSWGGAWKMADGCHLELSDA